MIVPNLRGPPRRRAARNPAGPGKDLKPPLLANGIKEHRFLIGRREALAGPTRPLGMGIVAMRNMRHLGLGYL
jgi:hypothetical protein